MIGVHQPLPDSVLLAAETTRARRWCLAALVAALGIVWASCLTLLSAEWRLNPEYAHGWLMPLAVIALLYMRVKHYRLSISGATDGLSWRVSVLVGAALLGWWSIRLVGHANPDWHFISWVTFLGALAWTWALLYWVFGKDGVACYGLPFIIIAGATPLPFVLEQHLIESLRTLTAATTLDFLHLAGIAAHREAPDLITLRHTVLGVEDGCTGIRSLHLCLAAGLFWGELHRLSLGRRFLLLFLAAGCALVLNILRSVFLALISEWGGVATFDEWHELAGFATQVTALALGGLALWLVCRSGVRAPTHGEPQETLELLDPIAAPDDRMIARRTWVIALLALLFVGLEMGRKAWYHSAPLAEDSPLWSFHAPRQLPDFRRVSVPRSWNRTLGANDSLSGEWRCEEGRTRALHFFHWDEDNQAGHFVHGHNPEVCLSGAGFQLKQNLGSQVFWIDGHRIAFHGYRFSHRGREFTVFHGVWDAMGRNCVDPRTGISHRRQRLQKAWEGEAFRGRRVIEIGFWDTDMVTVRHEMNDFLQETVNFYAASEEDVVS